MLKRIFWIFCFCNFFYLLSYAYEEWSGDFRLSHILYDLKEDAEIAIHIPEQDLLVAKSILTQPFKWLGHGRQVYAFVSNDGQYVLKILKFKRLRPSSFIKILSYFPYGKDYAEKAEALRLRRIEKIFHGYSIAYQKDQENTGIRFVQLKRGLNFDKPIQLIDRLGIPHTINANQILFAIQNRAIMTKQYFSKLLDEGNIPQVKTALARLFNMYQLESEKGLMDMDQNVMINTGFIRSKPMRLDIGQLKEFPNITKAQVHSDLTKIADKRLASWFQKHYPKHSQELIIEMQKLLELMSPNH